MTRLATRAARFAAAYAVLRAAHDVGDHIAQTDAQAIRKRDSWRAMAGHLASYHALQLAALAAARPLGVRPSPARALAAVAVSAVTHGFLDRRWPVIELLTATGSWNFANPTVRTTPNPDGSGEHVGPVPLHGPYLADQAAHHAALTVCAAILAGGTP